MSSKTVRSGGSRISHVWDRTAEGLKGLASDITRMVGERANPDSIALAMAQFESEQQALPTVDEEKLEPPTTRATTMGHACPVRPGYYPTRQYTTPHYTVTEWVVDGCIHSHHVPKRLN
jgi:hypothetical protein